jgi:hypothetical protein
VCYELAADFADLYRGYGGGGAEEGSAIGGQLETKNNRRIDIQTERSAHPKRKRIP